MSGTMNWLLRLLGVSAGDAREVARYRSSWMYALLVAYRSLLRLVANHCVVPSLRTSLFRLSGVRIGARTRVNMNINFIDDFRPGLISIEDKVSVAPFVSFVASSHPNDSELYSTYGISDCAPIRVKSGAWLGVGCVVLPGVTVGRESIIGANAVVTRDVEDFAIMAGVPAKKIGDVRERRREKSKE